MRILIFGKNGQIGRELQRTLPMLGQVTALSRADADLTDLVGIREILYSHAPDIIVNAAGYTAVNRAENDEQTAFTVNAEAVEVLADYARYNGSLLVHYSTDYVFDGLKSGPYIETDVPNPLSVYGKSKQKGEEAVMQGGCHYLIFRTSWVYSSHGRNFIRNILKSAQERDSLDVVSDQIGSPTSAELIADVTAISIAACLADILPEGMYHLTASGETSWHGLACHVVERALSMGTNLRLKPEGIYSVLSEEQPVTALRPKNSRLDTGKLTARLGFEMPHWTHHVNRAVDQILYKEQYD